MGYEYSSRVFFFLNFVVAVFLSLLIICFMFYSFYICFLLLLPLGFYCFLFFLKNTCQKTLQKQLCSTQFLGIISSRLKCIRMMGILIDIQKLEMIVSINSVLVHFMPLVSFDTTWKHLKPFGFLIFSGGIERDQWHEMG